VQRFVDGTLFRPETSARENRKRALLVPAKRSANHRDGWNRATARRGAIAAALFVDFRLSAAVMTIARQIASVVVALP
jgi:hypothetical protein